MNPNTHIIWTWKALTVLKAEEVSLIKYEHTWQLIAHQYFIVFATASPTITTSNIAGGESADGDSEDQTRLVAIEFKDTLRLQDETSCAKIGDWIISGPAEGVALHHASGGENNLCSAPCLDLNPEHQGELKSFTSRPQAISSGNHWMLSRILLNRMLML